MAGFRIELSSQAERVIRRMAEREPVLHRRISGAIDDLSADPHLGKPLKGQLHGTCSLRVGSYRILYEIHLKEVVILIVDVGHRRDVYR